MTLVELETATEMPQVVEPRVRSALAVLVSSFPRIDETFILREINELERLGQPVLLVPLRRERARVVHEEAKPWLGRALYLPAVSTSIIVSNLKELFADPKRYLGLLGQLVAGTIARPKLLLRTVKLFPKAVHLARVLTQRGITHVHAHFASDATTMAYVISSFSNISYSFSVHGPDIYVHRELLEQKLEKAKFVRAISTFNKAFLCGLYPAATAEKIRVVHTGVNPDVYAEAASAVAEKTGPFQILCVASLIPSKGIPILIDACAMLVKEGFDIECRIVGDGPLRGELQDLIGRSSAARQIHLLGPQPQHEVARLMGECDVFVLPSIIEYSGQMDGIPICLMEAMAAGRPVVASAISGIPELVEHERSGIVIDATNPSRVAGALRYLLRNPEVRNEMGRAGQKKVRREFDVRRTAAGLIDQLDFFEKTLRRSAGESISLLKWQELNVVALGIHRIQHRLDSFIADVTIMDGISSRDVVVKQHRSGENEGRDASSLARDEVRVLATLRRKLAAVAADRTAHVVYSVPRVLLFDDTHGAVVMEPVQGKPLDLLIQQTRVAIGGRLITPLRRTGTWLRLMQDQTHSDDDGRHILTATVVVALRDLDLAAAANAWLRRNRTKIADELRRLEAIVASKSLPVVGHHGDFWPGNIFAGDRRLDVIDFEGFREGLALEDVAYFLVQLEMFFKYPILDASLEGLKKAFLQGYGAERLDGETFRLFTLCKALQVLARGGTAAGGGWSNFWRRRTLRNIIRRNITS